MLRHRNPTHLNERLIGVAVDSLTRGPRGGRRAIPLKRSYAPGPGGPPKALAAEPGTLVLTKRVGHIRAELWGADGKVHEWWALDVDFWVPGLARALAELGCMVVVKDLKRVRRI